MNAVDDIATVISDIDTGYEVQKDFFNDKDGFEEFIVIRSAGGSYASLMEGQAVEITVVGAPLTGRVPRDKIEQIKSRLIGHDWINDNSVDAYHCDVVGGIIPRMISDDRPAYSIDVIVRYTRDEAIRS